MTKIKRSIFFYIASAFRELKSRFIERRRKYQKPTKILINHTFHPYSPELSLKEKYEIIGQKCLENKLILQKN